MRRLAPSEPRTTERRRIPGIPRAAAAHGSAPETNPAIKRRCAAHRISQMPLLLPHRPANLVLIPSPCSLMRSPPKGPPAQIHSRAPCQHLQPRPSSYIGVTPRHNAPARVRRHDADLRKQVMALLARRLPVPLTGKVHPSELPAANTPFASPQQ